MAGSDVQPPIAICGELVERAVVSAYEHIETCLPGCHTTGQTGVVASPIRLEYRQETTPAGCAERTRSRTARPDTQPVEVSWKVISSQGLKEEPIRDGWRNAFERTYGDLLVR